MSRFLCIFLWSLLVWTEGSPGEALIAEHKGQIIHDLVVAIGQEAGKEPVVVCCVVEARGILLDTTRTLLFDLVRQAKAELPARQPILWSLVSVPTSKQGEGANIVVSPTSNPDDLCAGALQLRNIATFFRPHDLDPIRLAIGLVAPEGRRRIIVALNLGATWQGFPPPSLEDILLQAGNPLASRTVVYSVTPETAFESLAYHVGTIHIPAKWSMSGKSLTYDYWESRGLSICRAEVIHAKWPFGTGCNSEIPSGFPSYVCSLLALTTGGRAFALHQEGGPTYDRAKLASYAPEIIPLDEYRSRNKSSRLRTAIVQILDWWKMLHLFTTAPVTSKDLRSRAEDGLRRGREMAPIVDQHIKCLEDVKMAGERDPHAPLRWQANLDLNLAMLCKVRSILPQYAAVLQQCIEKGFPPKDKQDDNTYVMKLDDADLDLIKGSEQDSMFSDAEIALSRVITTHAGTPWAEVAKRERAVLGKRIVMGTCRVNQSVD